MSKLKEMVLAALLSAILVLSKEVLAFLPNIELISFLLILFGRHFKLRNTLLIASIFCLIQIVLYGFGDWSIMYFIVWNGLVLISFYTKNKLKKGEHLALFSGLFGLLFGAFFALPYLVFSYEAAFAYWIKGLFFDLVHALGNYLIMLVLFDKVDSRIGEIFKEL